MIWTKRDRDGNIIHITSDFEKFETLTQAIHHINTYYDELFELAPHFEKMYSRKEKLEKLLKKLR